MPEGASKMVSDNTSDILEGYLDEAIREAARGFGAGLSARPAAAAVPALRGDRQSHLLPHRGGPRLAKGTRTRSLAMCGA
jgi:hypothetical protein